MTTPKPKLKRRENWPSLLASYIEQNSREPFVWGRHDCCLFAANWVRLCTGVDLAGPWRGRYRSERGAYRILREAGGIKAIVAAHFPRTRTVLAKRGDLVFYRGNGGVKSLTLGILEGRFGVFAGTRKLMFIPRDELQRTAWKMGEA